MSQIWSIKC